MEVHQEEDAVASRPGAVPWFLQPTRTRIRLIRVPHVAFRVQMVVLLLNDVARLQCRANSRRKIPRLALARDGTDVG